MIPDIPALLAPLSEGSPCGVSMRYEPLYAAIRLAREEEDSTLPQGVWERPLKKADWKEVQAKCTQLLGQHSKDLQVAAWLCEALIHLEGVPGFLAGAELLSGLVEQYWADVHPQIEDGDDDARAAPFIWINESLAHTLLLQLPIVQVAGYHPARVTLAVWDQIIAQDQKSTPEQRQEQLPSGAKPLTRDAISSSANGANLQKLLLLKEQLEQTAAQWERLTALLDTHMPSNAPSIARVGELIRRIHWVVDNLIDGRYPVLTAVANADDTATNDEAAMQGQGDEIASTESMAEASIDEASQVPHDGPGAPAMVDSFLSNPAPSITGREEAYRQLELIAEYLHATEPHSPTPYLIRRAVVWGGMTLAELIQEARQEDGDIERFFAFLGLRDGRDRY